MNFIHTKYRYGNTMYKLLHDLSPRVRLPMNGSIYHLHSIIYSDNETGRESRWN